MLKKQKTNLYTIEAIAGEVGYIKCGDLLPGILKANR